MTFLDSQGKVVTLYKYNKVGKCIRYWCQVFSGFHTPKIIKIG